MGTTSFDVIDWLVAAFVADSTLQAAPKVQIIEGEVGEHTEREHVAVGAIVAGDQAWATLGNRDRQEIYTVDIEISSRVPGATRTECKARVKALFQAVEAVLRATPSTTVSGVIQAEMTVPSYQPYIDEEGFSGLCRFQIRVTARI